MMIHRHLNLAGEIEWEIADNGDGTGTRTSYTDGEPTGVEQLTGLPIPEPTPADPLDALLAALADAQTLEEVRLAAQEAST